VAKGGREVSHSKKKYRKFYPHPQPIENAKRNTMGTGDGLEMLCLKHDPTHFCAANRYLEALDAIRELKREIRYWKYHAIHPKKEAEK
jgi:hypothetical protein